MVPEFLHPWLAIATTVSVFVTLQVTRRIPIDLLFLLALVFLVLTGVLSPAVAISGFASRAVLAISALLVVAAGLRSTGVLDWIGNALLGDVKSEGPALRRIAGPIVASSAFILNTALVAMMMPVLIDWCRQRNLSPSKLLLPLSYLTILGGVCTLIGTSTTLVVNDQLRLSHTAMQAEVEHLQEETPLNAAAIASRQTALPYVAPMGFFEIGMVGLPCAIAGTLFLMFVGQKLLPGSPDLIEQLGDQRREYLVEMQVLPECRLVNKTVEVAGLRNLHGLYLIEIDRNGDIITPVAPGDQIRSGDRLVFTGVVSTIVDLEKIPGLVPAADQTYEFNPSSRQQRHMTEVVLSRTSPLIGSTVRQANFRALYNAAVIAVHRNGMRLTNKIGNIELEPGDTLLLQTRGDFIAQHRNSRDFYLVSSVEGAEPRRHDRALLAAGLMSVLILWMTLAALLGGGGLADPAIAALSIAALMVLLQCVKSSDARAAIDLQVVVTIAAALGLGSALWQSGAASMIAEALVQIVGPHPYLLLVVIYLLAMIFTEMITNAAVAALLLPIAIAVAIEGDLNPRPFIMAIALAASLSFLTPIGYQTNLMVMGPGGYKPRDYLVAGIPLALIVATTALVLIPLVWPLTLGP
ncbi:SLC13 family permease [Blastopirellula sp. J2-11]|uniref:SLC13 family permease n=1 Tax=Blastopirellula sp. J2-11 TaxID=2943192 RepID=UPI0021C877C4|nr:SLC13 family permease [Blastopirellula sp. J2-11]UUO05501.1 SLC13 family permease [Blastopirellula sp. J2-11]